MTSTLRGESAFHITGRGFVLEPKAGQSQKVVMRATFHFLGRFAFGLALAASVCHVAAQTPTRASAPQSSAAQAVESLTSRGLGAVRLGMSGAHVRLAFARPLKVQSSGPETCLTLASPDGNVAFTLRDDRLRLIDIYSGNIATRSGLAVGMPLTHAKQTFGSELEIGTNFYNDATTEAIVWEPDHKHGVRFTASDGLITQITAGDEALQWVEGCGV